MTNLKHNSFLCVYFNSLHVSSNTVLIIRRINHINTTSGRVRLKPDGTRWRTGGEVKGKLANGVGSQYSHTTSGRGVSSITTADAHTSAASIGLKWLPRWFKWTRSFRRKTKSGFCACAITFQTHYTCYSVSVTVSCAGRKGTVRPAHETVTDTE